MSGIIRPGQVAPIARQPGVQMLVNGQPMPGLMTMTVQQNSFLSANTFTAEIALDATGQGVGAAWWAGTASIEIDLGLILRPGSKPQRVILGLADEVRINAATRLLAISGRDYTSLFTDVRTTEKFQNQTSSQIVATLAQRVGLTADVTATESLAGKYYADDNARLTDDNSYWTLMSFLAQQEIFDLWLDGRTVRFHPTADPTKTRPYPVNYAPGPIPMATVSELQMNRALTLAKDIVVKVIGWNREHKTAVKSTRQQKKTASPRSAHATARMPTAPNAKTATTYVFREAGLTQAQADAFAEQKLADLSKHERVIDFTAPGDLTLTPRSIIRLSGTGTSFDQDYYPSEVSFTCGFETGFSMRVSAKNHSAASTVTL